MSWFDAGVNLLDARFDVEQIIYSARSAGVERICVITTHPNEWQKARELYTAYPQDLVYTLGIHPHNAKDATEEDLNHLPELFDCPGAVAVGECGLDFNRDFSPRPRQIDVFKAQITIAKDKGLPIYLHERDAFDVQIQTLDSIFERASIRGIAHCFTGDKQQMQAYLERGLYIGITGWLCDEKRGQSLREAIKHLPLDKLILETDAPYLFPKTLRPRQKNNTPEVIPFIGETFAQISRHDINHVENTSYTNAQTLFGLTK